MPDDIGDRRDVKPHRVQRPSGQETVRARVCQRSAIPSATYRLQLHRGFTFADARGLVPYLSRLGISHLYLSPVLTARAGSIHGYDVVDHSRINPELGGEARLRELAEAAHAAGLGLILDIVPNHMAVGGADNLLWLDVLEKGRDSRYARWFDIDFDPPHPELAGKLLVPVLGVPYGDALRDGQISLIWEPAIGKIAFAYGPHRMPLAPACYREVTAGVGPDRADLRRWNTPDALHRLLQRQHFYLAWWRTAGDMINWRRFFDINELAGLRIEDDAVFDAVHEVVLRLFGDGVIDGLRIDHIDGLAEPAAYLRRLRRCLDRRTPDRPAAAPSDGPYIVVEKILGDGEALPADWAIDGTSGYDFMDQVSALQHDADGEAELDALWIAISDRAARFEIEETVARRNILEGAFTGQLDATARAFARLAVADLSTRDLTAESFRRAIKALIARLRIYRGYATGREEDAPPLPPAYIEALRQARADVIAEATNIDFMEQTLAGRGPGRSAQRVEAVRRLNQLTAPVAAKAVEDTALYRHRRLLSRNDVGFTVGRLALARAAFLRLGRERGERWPNAMLTTATHDHKHGEDLRARLAVVSEIPAAWREAFTAWMAVTARRRPAELATDDLYSLFQVLVGAWPLDLAPGDREGLARFADRIAGWREKSLREAKLRSSWAAPNDEYESASRAWIAVLLDPDVSADALADVREFVDRIAPAGTINGVVQAALRCTLPGVPDLYQGAELWDLSLIDPDNRRPVDYALREQFLCRDRRDWVTGAVKQATIAGILALRRADPELFRRGTIEPLAVDGLKTRHVLAFRRGLGSRILDVAVMLHVANATSALGVMPGAGWWDDTRVRTRGGWIEASRLFATGPVFVRAGQGAE